METNEEKAMRLLDEYEALLNKSIQMNLELMKTLKKMIGEKKDLLKKFPNLHYPQELNT